jgi:protein O-mannosyl-transferase
MEKFISQLENSIRIHLLFLIFFPTIVFIQCVGFDLTGFDDSYIIEDVYNRTRDVPQDEEMVKQNAIQALGNFGNTFYRPVQFATYVVDSTISGKEAWMYHISNLLIHLATVLAIYAFLCLHYKKITALIFAGFFSIHPVFASSVAWIPSRGDILLGLFGILLLMCFHLYWTTRKASYFYLHAILFLILLFTKETAILFPVLLVLYAAFVLHEKWTVKRLIPSLLAWLASTLVYFFVRKSTIATERSGDLFGLVSFQKNLPAIPTMLGNFFLPFKLASLPLYERTSILIGILLFFPIFFFISRNLLQKKYMPAFGFLWFLMFTVPPMFYRLPNAEYYFTYLEHRAYLPFIGLLFIVAPMFEQYLPRLATQYAILPFFGILTFFSVLTFSHTRDYKSNIVFFDAALKERPKNAMALLNKGIVFNSLGQQDSAIANINRSIKIYKYPPSFYHRGCVREAMHDTATAERDYTVAIMLDSSLVLAYVGRANIYTRQGAFQDAILDLNKAIAYDSTYSIAYYNRGNVYMALNQYQEAFTDYSKAIDLLPGYTNALINRGIVQHELHEYQNSLRDYQKALLLAPGNILVYNNMGVTLREMGQFEEAIGFFNKALSLNSNFAPAYFGRGTVHLKMNNKAEACRDWRKAEQLGFSAASRFIHQYCQQ